MKTLKPYSPLLLGLLLSCTGCQKQSTSSYISIVSAMDIEINLLLKEAKIHDTKSIGNVTVHVGELRGKNVVISRSGIAFFC